MVSPSAFLRRALSNHERGNIVNRVLDPLVLRQAQDERAVQNCTSIWSAYLAPIHGRHFLPQAYALGNRTIFGVIITGIRNIQAFYISLNGR